MLRDVKINQRAEVVGVYRTLVIYTERKKAREQGKYSSIEDPSYTKADIEELDEIYAAEKRSGCQPRYWEDVVVGEEMGTMAKGPLTTTDIIVFHAGGYGFVPYGLKSGRLAYKNRQRIPAFYIDNAYGVSGCGTARALGLRVGQGDRQPACLRLRRAAGVLDPPLPDRLDG